MSDPSSFHSTPRVYRIGAVSYLNTRPLVYGLEQGLLAEQVQLYYDYPAQVAAGLIQGRYDISLIPVGALPSLPHYQVVSEYGIACYGAVDSVAIFGDCRLEDAETLILDYQSRTSVALAQVLLRKYWKKSLRFEAATPGFEDRLGGTTMGVIIGDRAFTAKKRYSFMYDLGQVWKDMTGLPFIFAVWASVEPVPADFAAAFSRANAVGFQHLDEIIAQIPAPETDLKHYYTQSIRYRLDADALQGMKLFLELLDEHPIALSTAKNT